jgi:signal peptidase
VGGSKKEVLSYAIVTIALIVFLFSLGSILSTPVPLAVVSSWSMDPVLHVGDIVVVSGQRDYSVGDIVIYDSGRGIIVHRVVAKADERFVVKGDANPTPDSVQPTGKMVLGKVQIVIPYLGGIKLIFSKG